jgi:hypothetical protein
LLIQGVWHACGVLGSPKSTHDKKRCIIYNELTY